MLDAANAAADQYLENIVRMEQETQQWCRKMLEDAQTEANRILAKAKEQQAAAETVSEEDIHKSLHELLGEVRVLIGEENE